MSIFKKKNRLVNTSVKYGVKLVAEQYPTSSIAEQFRTVMTNISFANVGQNIHSLAITSGDPSEGKSTISANLAVTYAKQGKNVIMVDADMRRPTVHKTFLKSNHYGLSSYLSGAVSLDDVVSDTSIDNLKVITSGPIPPNPSALLGSNRMNDIFGAFNNKNDLVIFDLPPVNTMTDTSLIASTADGTLMVIPQGIAEKKSTKLAIDQLKKVHANILGSVMNMVTDNKQNNDYYYYYSK